MRQVRSWVQCLVSTSCRFAPLLAVTRRVLCAAQSTHSFSLFLTLVVMPSTMESVWGQFSLVWPRHSHFPHVIRFGFVSIVHLWYLTNTVYYVFCGCIQFSWACAVGCLEILGLVLSQVTTFGFNLVRFSTAVITFSAVAVSGRVWILNSCCLWVDFFS